MRGGVDRGVRVHARETPWSWMRASSNRHLGKYHPGGEHARCASSIAKKREVVNGGVEGRHPPGATHQVPPTRCHPPGATQQVPPTRCHPPGATQQVPPTRCHPPGATHQVPPTRCHLPGATHQVPPTRCHPQGATHQVPPTRCHPQRATQQVPPTRCHQPGATNLVPPSRCHPPCATHHESSMRVVGAQAQATCSAEADFIKLVAATQRVKGDPGSKVDREVEWMASRSTKCMRTKHMQKGLDGAGAEQTWMHVQAK